MAVVSTVGLKQNILSLLRAYISNPNDDDIPNAIKDIVKDMVREEVRNATVNMLEKPVRYTQHAFNSTRPTSLMTFGNGENAPSVTLDFSSIKSYIDSNDGYLQRAIDAIGNDVDSLEFRDVSEKDGDFKVDVYYKGVKKSSFGYTRDTSPIEEKPELFLLNVTLTGMVQGNNNGVTLIRYVTNNSDVDNGLTVDDNYRVVAASYTTQSPYVRVMSCGLTDESKGIIEYVVSGIEVPNNTSVDVSVTASFLCVRSDKVTIQNVTGTNIDTDTNPF